MKNIFVVGIGLMLPAFSYAQSSNQYRFLCSDPSNKISADLKFEENVNPNLGVFKNRAREYQLRLRAVRNRANVTTGFFETILVYASNEISTFRYIDVLLNPNDKSAKVVKTNEFSEPIQTIADLKCKIVAGPVDGVFNDNR